MPFAAAVKFKENGASKYFNPGGLDVRADDFVWVKDPGTGGLERIGFVSCMEGRAAIQMGHLPKVLRLAGETEVEQWYELKIEEREMIELARDRAEAHELPIKISDLVFNPDKRQVLIQFTSDHRVDFRELVRDLAGHFKARIEMWQIGARKEAGLKEGYGICGNPLCCGSWLKDFPSITMKYAREQDIVQPPSKLSGPCGKLRCCLRYEHETYLELADGVATRGCTGCSSDGKCGVVVDRNLLKQELTVKTDEGSFVSVPVGEFEEDAEGRPGRRRAEAVEAAPSRQEPKRWGPGEPPEPEAEESVEAVEDGEFSATTGPVVTATEPAPADAPEPRERRDRGERPSRGRRPRGGRGRGRRRDGEPRAEAGGPPAAGGEGSRARGERRRGGGVEKSSESGPEGGERRGRRGRSRRGRRRGGPRRSGGSGGSGEGGGAGSGSGGS